MRLRELDCAAGQHPSLFTNVGPRVCGCKDFIVPGCVVGSAGDKLPINALGEM